LCSAEEEKFIQVWNNLMVIIGGIFVYQAFVQFMCHSLMSEHHFFFPSQRVKISMHHKTLDPCVILH